MYLCSVSSGSDQHTWRAPSCVKIPLMTTMSQVIWRWKWRWAWFSCWTWNRSE